MSPMIKHCWKVLFRRLLCSVLRALVLVLSSLSFVPFHVLFVPLSFCVRVSVFLCLSRSLSLCPSCSFCVPRSLPCSLYIVSLSLSVCFSSPYFVVIVSCPACIMFSFASCVSSVTSEHKLIFRTTRLALGGPCKHHGPPFAAPPVPQSL